MLGAGEHCRHRTRDTERERRETERGDRPGPDDWSDVATRSSNPPLSTDNTRVSSPLLHLTTGAKINFKDIFTITLTSFGVVIEKIEKKK